MSRNMLKVFLLVLMAAVLVFSAVYALAEGTESPAEETAAAEEKEETKEED